MRGKEQQACAARQLQGECGHSNYRQAERRGRTRNRVIDLDEAKSEPVTLLRSFSFLKDQLMVSLKH